VVRKALGQTRQYLQRHFPSAVILPVTSTAAAAQYAASHPEAAAIGSSLAAELYGLALVDRGEANAGIQDAASNETTFGVFAGVDRGSRSD
jgi:prephenate dehydratase